MILQVFPAKSDDKTENCWYHSVQIRSTHMQNCINTKRYIYLILAYIISTFEQIVKQIEVVKYIMYTTTNITIQQIMKS